jgi:hypothetical protein
MLINRLIYFFACGRLRQHYFLGSGGSTPKAKLFQEYLDMCRDESFEATSNSAFGKLVRTYVPPQLTSSSCLCCCVSKERVSLGLVPSDQSLLSAKLIVIIFILRPRT